MLILCSSHLCSTAARSPWRTSCLHPSEYELNRYSHCPEATSPATGTLHGSYPPGTTLPGRGIIVLHQTISSTSSGCMYCLASGLTRLWRIVQVFLQERQWADQVWCSRRMEELACHKLSGSAAQQEKPRGEVEFTWIWNRRQHETRHITLKVQFGIKTKCKTEKKNLTSKSLFCLLSIRSLNNLFMHVFLKFFPSLK